MMLLTSASTTWTIQEVGVLASLFISTSTLVWSMYRARKSDILNSQMLENSTRPVISIYSVSVDSGAMILYLVVKNFGKTQAVIKKIDDLGKLLELNGYLVKNGKDFIQELNDSVLAPGQSRTIALSFNELNQQNIKFDLTYASPTKTYKESMIINVTAGTNLPTSKFATNGKELASISYSLQEMLQKSI